MPALTRQKITFAEMRAAGVRGVLIYCSDYKCSHSTAISGDRWPDHVRLFDLEGRFVCRACGTQGAEVGDRGWKRPCDDPIPLPSGRKLVTLHDAAAYATQLPKKETNTAEWQAAIEGLMLVAELGGPTMFARIGMLRALTPNPATARGKVFVHLGDACL